MIDNCEILLNPSCSQQPQIRLITTRKLCVCPSPRKQEVLWQRGRSLFAMGTLEPKSKSTDYSTRTCWLCWMDMFKCHSECKLDSPNYHICDVYKFFQQVKVGMHRSVLLTHIWRSQEKAITPNGTIMNSVHVSVQVGKLVTQFCRHDATKMVLQ